MHFSLITFTILYTTGTRTGHRTSVENGEFVWNTNNTCTVKIYTLFAKKNKITIIINIYSNIDKINKPVYLKMLNKWHKST